MFAWRMTRPVNLFSPFTGLPLVGLRSFAVQTSIKNRSGSTIFQREELGELGR